MNKEEKRSELYKVDINGSLGILAHGDVGLRAWRKVKKQHESTRDGKKK